MKPLTILASALALLAASLLPATPAQGPPVPPVTPPQVEGHSLAAGTIIMWSGSVSSLPTGWSLCDGTDGTPDLRDRFLRGAPAGQEPGAVGGAHSIQLGVENLPAHDHLANVLHSSSTHSHTYDDLVNPSAVFWVFGIGSIGFPGDVEFPWPAVTYSNADHTHTGLAKAAGGGGAVDLRPAYHRLAFLMKDSEPGAHLPVGAIVPWTRSLRELPRGWALCDGKGGTPDLRERLPLSVRDGEQPGEVGGANLRSLDLGQLPSHEHGIVTKGDGSHQHDKIDLDISSTAIWDGGLVFLPMTSSNIDSVVSKTSVAGEHDHGVFVGTRGSSAAYDNRPAYGGLPMVMLKGSSSPMSCGAVVAWSGLRKAIPEGWAECDGAGGRPELRGRFLGGTAGLQIAGGQDQVALTIQTMPQHHHSGQLDPGGAHDHSFQDGFREALTWGTGGLFTNPMAYGPPITVPGVTESAGAHSHDNSYTSSVGGYQPFDNRPAYREVLFLVRQ